MFLRYKLPNFFDKVYTRLLIYFFKYLGTCQVKDISNPDASRQAIFKMKVSPRSESRGKGISVFIHLSVRSPN